MTAPRRRCVTCEMGFVVQEACNRCGQRAPRTPRPAPRSPNRLTAAQRRDRSSRAWRAAVAAMGDVRCACGAVEPRRGPRHYHCGRCAHLALVAAWKRSRDRQAAKQRARREAAALRTYRRGLTRPGVVVLQLTAPTRASRRAASNPGKVA